MLLILGLSAQINYSQYNNVNVTLRTPNPNSVTDFMDRQKQNDNELRAIGSANNAAYNEAMKDNYNNVTIDKLISSSNSYKYVVIENVRGWSIYENRQSLIEILQDAKKYTIIDLSKDYKSNGKEIKNNKKSPINLIDNKEVLYISWLREAQGNSIRITQFSVKNSEGKVVYESISKNLGFQEILKPLISNYIFTKEQALSKIQDLKKYLDLEIITKAEYDLKVTELKPILLSEN